jgi:uncharacterized protein YjbI with pentapeptide repeats
MDFEPGLTISKPKHFLKKEIAIKSGPELLKALTKVLTISSKLDNLPDILASIMKNLNLESNEAELAWLLIYVSFRKALRKLIREVFAERLGSNLKKLESDTQKLERQLVEILQAQEYKINDNFFHDPQEFPAVKRVSSAFNNWLSSQSIHVAKAKSISNRLPRYFLWELHNEWKTNKYSKIENNRTPFDKNIERTQAWVRNSAFLQKQVEKTLILENISLNQVYVPLRAYYKTIQQGDSLSNMAECNRSKRVVVDLTCALETWLNEANPEDSIRLISGGPGSGKSSFAQMFAAKVAADDTIPVLFIPMHKFDTSKDFNEAIGTFVEEHHILPRNPLTGEDRETSLFIIFDGLDELAMQGKIAKEVAKDFIIKVLTNVNRPKPKLKVLITGRELVVPSSGNLLRDNQILILLPYYVKKTDRINYLDEKGLLQYDQRVNWWRNYGETTGKGFKDLPPSLATESLTEITSQPLLNYLLAIHHLNGKRPISESTNLNTVYANLISDIHERAWANQRNSNVTGIDFPDFILVLQQIALAAWHGNGRTTTIAEINDYCKNSYFENLLERFEKNYKANPSENMTRLMIAFYFGYKDRNAGGKETFEFTHKNFGEYLTAVRIVRAIKEIDTELRTRNPTSLNYNENNLLRSWAEICGPTPMDQYLCNFVLNEIRLQTKDVVSCWQDTLTILFNFMLTTGMPMDEVKPRPKNFNDQNIQAINAEEALLVVLNCCTQVTQKNSKINPEAIVYFGNWIARVQSQRMDSSNNLVFNSLSFLNIEKLRLDIRNLCYANLENSKLEGSYLKWANLVKANLRQADLENANLIEAYLKEVDLCDANLVEAKLQGANLQSANLLRTNLQGANLSETKLQGANLQGANLTNANLSGANLQDSDLTGATVKNAVFNGTYLEGTRLEGVNMNDTKGEYTNLQSELTDLDEFKLHLDKKLRKSDELDGDKIMNLCRVAVEYLREKMSCQIACIYLMDKDGYIVRFAVSGDDEKGNPIDQNWLYDEDLKKTEPYEPGQGFTGKGILKYGEKMSHGIRSMHSDHLEIECQDELNYPYGKRYRETLGKMKSGMTDKIIGDSRAYGSIDVFSKKDKCDNLISFSTNDFLILKTTSASVATYISNFRSNNRNLIFTNLLDDMFDLISKSTDLKNICNNLAKSLISSPTPYKVCVIRLFDGNVKKFSDLALQHTLDINWNCTSPEQNLPQEDSKRNITQQAIATNELQFLESIDEYFDDPNNFSFTLRHPERYKINKLKSVYCFPLSFQNNAFGTITVLGGYPYIFSVEEKDFMSHIASFLGYIVKGIPSNDNRTLQEKLS